MPTMYSIIYGYTQGRSTIYIPGIIRAYIRPRRSDDSTIHDSSQCVTASSVSVHSYLLIVVHKKREKGFIITRDKRQEECTTIQRPVKLLLWMQALPRMWHHVWLIIQGSSCLQRLLLRHTRHTDPEYTTYLRRCCSNTRTFKHSSYICRCMHLTAA